MFAAIVVSGGTGGLVLLAVWGLVLVAWLVFLFTAAWNLVIAAVRRLLGLDALRPAPAPETPRRCRRRLRDGEDSRRVDG